MAWYIKYGMGGGFGGLGDWEVSNSTTEESALMYAEEKAREEYESYEGNHGILSYEDFMEDNPEGTEEEFEESREQDIDSWIDYKAKWFEENPNED